MANSQKTNHLAQETSPYLKQHAHNPVDWYPWGTTALEKARRENKPILLSIGYAACHWCHVMAHESFEDEQTAEVMNKLFINIKVDREERPDLDKIYQTAHYLLTQQSGGWPLTLFLTPDDLTPFFSGTYFPREARYQLPGFKEILQAMADIYQHRPTEVKQQNAELIRMLMHSHPGTDGTDYVHLDGQPLQHALPLLRRSYDPLDGGFGGAPKFPQPTRLEFLLQEQSEMAPATLERMAKGGIYDQLGGGFYRYSVDAKWHIPHFEKMLYDNGQLLFLYALAAKYDAKPFFADIARETAEWAIHHMQSPEGGYYASIDADSEGHEGTFYVWDLAEIEQCLSREEYAVTRLYFGLDEPANFENHWHLYVSNDRQQVAEKLTMTLADVKKRLISAEEKLLIARNKRVPPHRDEKILTAWNGLMIKGMLTAGNSLHEPRFIDSAQRALSFIQQKLWQDKRLLVSYKDGKATLSAYLDDYVFLLDAVLTSLQMIWNTEQLLFAIDLADAILHHFSDQTVGGFYFTANDHEKLLYRPKSMMDEAIPAGNGVAVRSLLTLGHLLGDSRYLEAAEKTLQAAWPALVQYPADHATLLLALKDFLGPPRIIIIRGPEPDLADWQDYARSINNHVFAIPDKVNNLPGLLALKKPHDKICAYICQGMQCSAVIEDKHGLR
jgi:uncharacterized protein